MGTHSVVLSANTKDIIKDLKNLEYFFVFSKLSEGHGIFSNENKSEWKV